jgi:hypothetical protein
MRKRNLLIVLWTLALAVPFTALALFTSVLLIDHLDEFTQALADIDWQSLRLEASARWPELAGMFIGQLIIFVLIIMLRRDIPSEETIS